MKLLINFSISICLALLSFTCLSDVKYTTAGKLKSQADIAKLTRKEKNLRVTYMPPASEYNFYRTIGSGIEEHADEHGIDYSMLTPQIDNPHSQHQLLRSVVDGNQADLIILATHNPPLIAGTVEEAVNKGVAVILVNSDIPDFDTPVHAVVGYNQRNGTRKMGKYAKSFFMEKEVKVGILEGSAGYHSDERVGGFLEVIQSSPNFKIVAKENGRWNVEGGYYGALKMLKENPEIGLIFAANDYEIIGAMAAAKVLNKHGVIFLGNDGDIAAIEKISKGTLSATVNTDPFRMGQIALEVGRDILRGSFSGGFVETPTSITSQENIQKYYNEATTAKVHEIKNQKIVAMTAEGKELSGKSGQGLYIEILNMIYSPYGIQIEQKTVPFARAIKTIQYEKSDVDIVLGAFPGVIKNVHFPQWHYNLDTVSILFKSDRINWTGVESMTNRSVATIRNFNLNQYLYTDINLEEKSSRAGTIMMLDKGRVDFFLDVKSEALKSIEELQFDLKEKGIVLKDLLKIRQYACFKNNGKGVKLAEIFDDEFPRLIFSGKLKQLFEKWHVKYPFK